MCVCMGKCMVHVHVLDPHENSQLYLALQEVHVHERMHGQVHGARACACH